MTGKNINGPLLLLIMDGWGYSEKREGNAIALAKKPFFDEYWNKYPHTLIDASGRSVGLPQGVMGNSEVGHLNIGAGRIVQMDVSRIDCAIEDGSFFNNPALVAAMDNVKEKNSALHLMGLVSDGAVHSMNTHLYALLKMAKERGLTQVFVHCFTDGRDTPPDSGQRYVAELIEKEKEIGVGRIASVCGRYYAMDRDKRWERIEKAYRMLVYGEGAKFVDPLEGIRASYSQGVTDEFIRPIVIVNEAGEMVATIKDNDSVIFFNFRADRARQITRALTERDFTGFDRGQPPAIHFVCFTQYDALFPLPVAFPPQTHHNILAEIFAERGIRNLRVAETEKYAHVTFFFNGGVEKEFPCERRILVPSPKVATYDLQPEMSVFKVTNEILRTIDEGETDVFIVNFANADMVGHTGNLNATIKAIEAVDTCIGWVVKAILARNGVCIITADHGNAEQMIDPATGDIHTAHTTNLVPLLLISRDFKNGLRPGGSLEDIAPTMLGILGIEQPREMTGRDLRIRQ